MLPTFIVIGAMKSGTSSLHKYLNEHPEIGMSKHKELDFFKTTEDFAKGVDWYSKQFPSGYNVIGESSPNYSKCHHFPGAAERMHSVLPNISLIYILRNPIERAISHHVHQIDAGRESRPIENALEPFETNENVLCGSYMYQLQEFLKYYPSERILILKSEDLYSDRIATMSNIFNFLGVNPDFQCESFNKITHKGSDKRQSDFVDKQLSKIPFIPTKILKGVRKAFGAKVQRPTLTPELRSRLLDYYRADIEELEQFTGISFQSWLTPTSGT